MAFPIMALLTAAASDMQSRQEEKNAIRAAGRQSQDQILSTRARELGGSPYAGMAQDFDNALIDIKRQASKSRNNNIGALLQAYLKKDPAGHKPAPRSPLGPQDPYEKFGDEYVTSFMDQPNLQYNAPVEGIGMGDAMGKSQMDSWDYQDPWGDAGY